MKLFSYFRSSASYRVRIALNLKGLAYEYVPVNLLQDEQKSPGYLDINPLGLVPALVLDNGAVLTQSLAILEYLEETQPEPPLLPAAPEAKSRVRALAASVACEIQPLCNIGVTNHLKAAYGAGRSEIDAWYRHWIPRGFAALEQTLATVETPFASGEQPGMADIYLIPQVYNARRFKVDLRPYPHIERITAACNALSAFRAAAPEGQPDAP
ncbi:MAG: maleylacetoacetate isomerase [Pseudomonadota bacterium]